MDQSTIRDFRKKYRYQEGSDVFLASPYNEHDKEKRGFYRDLSKRFERLGKRLFIPSRNLNLKWPQERLQEIVNRIIIPSSDLVLSFSEQYPTNEGPEISITPEVSYRMVSRAYELEIPVVHLIKINHFLIPDNRYTMIAYKNNSEILEKLEDLLVKFYRFSLQKDL